MGEGVVIVRKSSHGLMLGESRKLKVTRFGEYPSDSIVRQCEEITSVKVSEPYLKFLRNICNGGQFVEQPTYFPGGVPWAEGGIRFDSFLGVGNLENPEQDLGTAMNSEPLAPIKNSFFPIVRVSGGGFIGESRRGAREGSVVLVTGSRFDDLEQGFSPIAKNMRIFLLTAFLFNV